MRKYRTKAQILELAEAAAAARTAGSTLKDIAHDLNVSIPYLHSLLETAERAAEIGKPVSVFDERKDDIVAMYRQVSDRPDAIAMIAESELIPQERIYKMLVEAGEITPRRRQGEIARIETGIRIVHLYVDDGKSIPEVAKEVGVSVPYVYKVLQTNNVPLKTRGNRQQVSENVLALYNEGYTVAQIAAELHLMPANVYPILYAAGISPQARKQKHELTEREKILDAYFGEHLSIDLIAAKFGHTKTKVWSTIEEELKNREVLAKMPASIDRLFPDLPGQNADLGELELKAAALGLGSTTPPMPRSIDELFPEPPGFSLDDYEKSLTKQSDENDDSPVAS